MDSRAGFTLVEVIAVVVVMGILAAMVAPRFILTDLSAGQLATLVRGHMRYAQLRAMDNEAIWGIRYTAATNTYTLFEMVGNTETQRAFPGDTDIGVVLTDEGFTIPTGDFIFSFDRRGQPYTDAGATTLLAANATVTLTDADDNADTVNLIVHEGTGYVQ